MAIMPPDFGGSEPEDRMLKELLKMLHSDNGFYSSPMMRDIVNTSLKNTVTKKATEEDMVIRILKGDFEDKFGMTFERFLEVYNNILEENPEKLI